MLNHAPGDATLEQLAEATAQERHAMPLSNHGPVVAGRNLSAALDAVGELEETAKIFLLFHGHAKRHLSSVEVQAVQAIS